MKDNDALAFWKDAVRQWWEAINDPQATKARLEGTEAYYMRVKELMKGEK